MGYGGATGNTETIFISYRRADASAWAMWLESRLQDRYGQDSVFRDLTRLQVGDEFEREIHRVLSSCKVAIVVIGPGWLERAATGVARLFEPDDFVRREIEQALARDDVHVIPVLVEGTAMPGAHELPPGLERLTRHHALDLSDARREYELSVLFEALERAGVTSVIRPAAAAGQPAPAQASYMPAIAALAMTAAAAIGAVIAAAPARDLGAHRFGAELPTRIAAYAAERAALWAAVGGLALAVASVICGRGPWLSRGAGAIGFLARGLVMGGFAGAIGGALWIVLRDKAHMQAFSANCISVTVTGVVLAQAFAQLSSASDRRYWLAAGLVGGLLTGVMGAAKALEVHTGSPTAAGHVLEGLLMVGIFGLTLAGLAMAPSGARGRTARISS